MGQLLNLSKPSPCLQGNYHSPHQSRRARVPGQLGRSGSSSGGSWPRSCVAAPQPVVFVLKHVLHSSFSSSFKMETLFLLEVTPTPQYVQNVTHYFPINKIFRFPSLFRVKITSSASILVPTSLSVSELKEIPAPGQRLGLVIPRRNHRVGSRSLQ